MAARRWWTEGRNIRRAVWQVLLIAFLLAPGAARLAPRASAMGEFDDQEALTLPEVRSEVDLMLRRRILDEGGVPYVWVELDPAWRLPWDIHPNAHAAHEIAAAIAARLRGN